MINVSRITVMSQKTEKAAHGENELYEISISMWELILF